MHTGNSHRVSVRPEPFFLRSGEKDIHAFGEQARAQAADANQSAPSTRRRTKIQTAAAKRNLVAAGVSRLTSIPCFQSEPPYVGCYITLDSPASPPYHAASP